MSNSLTTVMHIRCPGCQTLMFMPMLDDFQPTHDGSGLEYEKHCDRCEQVITFRLRITSKGSRHA